MLIRLAIKNELVLIIKGTFYLTFQLVILFL